MKGHPTSINKTFSQDQSQGPSITFFNHGILVTRLYITEVYRLSKGKDLEGFFELRAEVQASMEKDGITVPVARDPKYLMDLAFIVDIKQELNVLYFEVPVHNEF